MEELSDATGVMEVDRTYSYGLDLIAQDRFDVGSSAWDATFYLYDGHGNVRALADDTGTITDTYDYDAFGTLVEQLVLDISASGLVPVTTDNRDLITDNQYLYCGEQFDPDLGLYFLRARYMDTERGRFWSMDVFEGRRNEPLSLHKYLYAAANPVSYSDPTGHEFNLISMMHTVWIKGTVLAIKGYNLIRAVKVAKWAAAFANGTINGFYNVASTTFNKVNAFTIGFFGGFFGMFIGFGHPGAGAAFTTAYIKTGNALFDGKPFTWKDARSLAFSTVFSGAVGAFLGKGAEDGILRASEAFMIQFDIQLAEHVWGNLADAWRG